jgi:hypothetical protein
MRRAALRHSRSFSYFAPISSAWASVKENDEKRDSNLFSPTSLAGAASAVPVPIAMKEVFSRRFGRRMRNLLSEYPQRSAKIRGHFPQPSFANPSITAPGCATVSEAGGMVVAPFV